MSNTLGNNLLDMPLFMEEEKNYYFDKDKGKYVLTDNVSDEIKKSYDEFYASLIND